MLNVAGIQIFGVPTNGEFIDEDHTKESVAILGCKSKKKAMEASNTAKEKAKIEQEAVLHKQQEEEAMLKEAEERERSEAELKRAAEAKIIAPRTRLSQYFDAISTSTNVASAKIGRASCRERVYLAV